MKDIYFLSLNATKAPSKSALLEDIEGTLVKQSMVNIKNTWGQFHVTKLSVNSPEVVQNLLLERKTRENFSFKVSGVNFMRQS